jgi:hypothetical protein
VESGKREVERDCGREAERKAEVEQGLVKRCKGAKAKKTGLGSEVKIGLRKTKNTSMYAYMRTTLILEDQLFRKAKKEAVVAGTTLSQMVNTALRKYLMGGEKKEGKKSFLMPVFGEEKPLHQAPAQLADLRDEGR